MPTHDNTPRNDYWKAGDIALCIRGGVVVPPRKGNESEGYPEQGKQYFVESVKITPFVSSDEKLVEMLALTLKDGPINSCGRPVWPAKRFMKATPSDELVEEELVVSRTDRIFQKA